MPATQKITRFDVWHLQLPVNARRDHGIGSVEHEIDIVVLRLTCEDGTQGWGEASSWSVFTGSAEAHCAEGNAALETALLDGQVVVPQGPGLGLAVDPEKLNKYAVNISEGPRA